MSEAFACPKCTADRGRMKTKRSGLMYLECQECGFHGPSAATVYQALTGADRWAERRKHEDAIRRDAYENVLLRARALPLDALIEWLEANVNG